MLSSCSHLNLGLARVQGFRSDLSLILSNAILYNGESSYIANQAKKVVQVRMQFFARTAKQSPNAATGTVCIFLFSSLMFWCIPELYLWS